MNGTNERVMRGIGRRGTWRAKGEGYERNRRKENMESPRRGVMTARR